MDYLEVKVIVASRITKACCFVHHSSIASYSNLDSNPTGTVRLLTYQILLFSLEDELNPVFIY